MRYLFNTVGLFIHSNENIIGCLFACAGLLLYHFDIIFDNWLLIVVALYILGFRLTPAPPKIVVKYEGFLSSSELLILLSRLVQGIQNKIPTEMLKIVLEIKNDLDNIIPRYDDLKNNLQQKHVVQQIIVDYLPKILETYLRIPPVYRKIYSSKEKNSPLEIALSQLELLRVQTSKISQIITEYNTSDLKAHHRFLKSKFSQSL